jgi:hypothetical protein
VTYVPRTTPMPQQQEALTRLLPRPAYALMMETGTGKTKPGLDEFGTLEEAGEFSDLLVVAPAGCYRNWTIDKGEEEANWSEIRKHLSLDLLDRLRVATWRSSASGRRDVEELLQVGQRPRMLCVSVEALSSTRDAEAACLEFVAHSRRGALMYVDESTTIMHGDSRRTEAVMRIGAAVRRRRIMTGLITPTSPMNLYSQFQFLDWRILGFRSVFGFRARYSVLKKMSFGRVNERGRPITTLVTVGHRNLDELSRKIAPHSYRVLKKDCMDLPEKTYRIREVETTPEQRRVYDEMRRFCTARLDSGEHATATMVLAQMSALHRILCGHVRSEETGEIRPVASRRIAALMEEVGECEGKFIVWCSYDHDVRAVRAAVEKELGGGSCAAFWGGNASERGNDERRFLEDPRCRGMVATAAARGRGNTWTVATLAVYYSNTDNLEHRLQSEDRNHRIGQRNPVTYVDLMVPGTVDERYVRSMREKINMAAAISGDDYRKWVI